MIIDAFKAAIAREPRRPQNVKVSPDLFRELQAAKLIEMRDLAAWGAIPLGTKGPFYEDIQLIVDPELELTDESFRFPPG